MASLAGGGGAGRLQAAAVIVVALVVTGVGALKSTYLQNIPGDYCSTRSDPCCLQRMDECAVPILGTLCYCDEFCDREDNPDCCPDYARVCLGVTPAPPTPPAQCYHRGEYFPPGVTLTDNCNTCECSNSGHVVCTHHKCMLERTLLADVGLDHGAPDDPVTGNWGWTAANYSRFWGRRLSDGMTLRTGTIFPNYLMYPILLHYDPANIPSRFDAREKWHSRIGRPRDQGWCGASWAFSTVSVAGDRLAIESGGMEVVPLSPQNLVSCGRRGQQGCQGGKVEYAWQYLRKIGLVDEACYPYTSGQTGEEGTCRIPRRANLLQLRCAGDSQVTVGRKGLYKTEPAYRIKAKEGDIQYEIMTNGPVQALMTVEQDLFSYRRGVYASTGLSDPAVIGQHSVKLLGWGVEPATHGRPPVKYWLAMNSWGEEWGEDGLFRIRRGFNESGIERYILSIRLRLLNYNRRRRRHHRPVRDDNDVIDRDMLHRISKYRKNWFYSSQEVVLHKTNDFLQISLPCSPGSDNPGCIK